VIDDTLERGHGELGQGTSSIEDVLHHVREGMRQGRLVPGQRLAEPDLMQRLSVSRGTVREALVHLRAEGLVELERYRGARIRILSRRKVIELNQIRGVAEGLAARLVAEGLDKAGKQRLTAIHEPYDRVSGDYLGYTTSASTTRSSSSVATSACGRSSPPRCWRPSACSSIRCCRARRRPGAPTRSIRTFCAPF
jgi:DNA-binding transcriptional regulator YhcF (GntR family)